MNFGYLDDMTSVAQYGRQHASSYAGSFLTGDGHICVGFTSDVGARVAELRPSLAHQVQLVGFDARYTDNQLRHFSELVQANPTMLTPSGIQLVSVGVVVQANVVEVGVSKDVPQAGRIFGTLVPLDALRIVVSTGGTTS